MFGCLLQGGPIYLTPGGVTENSKAKTQLFFAGHLFGVIFDRLYGSTLQGCFQILCCMGLFMNSERRTFASVGNLFMGLVNEKSLMQRKFVFEKFGMDEFDNLWFDTPEA